MDALSIVSELVEQSIALERAGEMGAALERAHMAMKHARAQDDTEGIAAALVRAGEVYYRLGNYADARASADDALRHASDLSRARADALIVLGNCAFETGSLDDAESFFLGATDLCRQIGYEHSRFRALHNLAACVYAMRGQFDLALATYKQAYQIACELNSPLQAVTLIAMTYVYWQTRQLQSAHTTLDQLAQVASAATMYQGYSDWLRAQLALDEGDWTTAARCFARARSIAEQIGDPALNIFIRMGQSQYHRVLGNVPAALEWANDAVAWASRTGNRRMLGRALIERARAAWCAARGNANDAENDLRLAIQELGTRGQLYDLARAHFLLAALLHTQNHAEAESAWLEAAKQIVAGGYAYILDQDRALAYPLIAAHLNSANPTIAQISVQCIEYLQRVPPPPLRIVTLGAFQVWQGTRRVDPRALHKRRARELLALLLIAPAHTLAFDQIADALWRDKPPAATQALFHQATSTLRRALEPELPDKFPSRYVQVEEGRVTLHLPAGSTVDFQTFEAHCRAEEWDAALVLYGGDLFPDDRYAEWAIAPREHYKRLYLRALLITAHRQMRAGRAREALEACHRILEIDPWQEDAVLLGMRACLAFNDRAGAIRLYRQLERTLREELNTVPQAELRALYQSLI